MSKRFLYILFWILSVFIYVPIGLISSILWVITGSNLFDKFNLWHFGFEQRHFKKFINY